MKQRPTDQTKSFYDEAPFWNKISNTVWKAQQEYNNIS